MDFDRNIQLARTQSFSDELNKLRLQKIGAVWEQIDENEVALDKLLESINKVPGPDKTRFAQTANLITNDVVLINRNRFWLGEETYEQLQKYMSITDDIVAGSFLGRPGIDLSQSRAKRKAAKQSIINVRTLFLKGEQTASNSPSNSPSENR